MTRLPVAHDLPHLSLPAHVDGSQGRLRVAGDNELRAERDGEAIYRFLQEYKESPHTYRKYEKEVMRLFYWAVNVRGKAISDLDRWDYEAFENFLADPQPAADWCGPRRPRTDPAWRPFTGPLSSASIRHALQVVNSLLTYWVDGGYISGNPLSLRRLKGKHAPVKKQIESVDRFLDRQQWDTVWTSLEDLPRESYRDCAEYQRARYLLAILYQLGPRIGELEGTTHGAMFATRHEDQELWWLKVYGKGGKERDIPIPGPLLLEIQQFRVFHELPALPIGPEDATPFLPPLYLAQGRRKAGGVTARRVNQILKALLERAAARLEHRAPHKAAGLRQASAHWFRHTSITHDLDAGVPMKAVQNKHGHVNINTTQQYNHAEKAQLHRDASRRSLTSSSTSEDPA